MGKVAAVAGSLVALASLIIAFIGLLQAFGAQYSDDKFQQKHLSNQEIELTEVHRQVDLQSGLLAVQTSLLELQSLTPQATIEAKAIADQIAVLQATRTAILNELNTLGVAVTPTAMPQQTPSPTLDLSYGPNQPDLSRPNPKHNNPDTIVGANIAGTPTPRSKNYVAYVGNLITCVPSNPPNYAWIWIYRLSDKNIWVRIGRGIPSINPSGYLKIDGLPVDASRFGTRGEPYKIEQVIDNHITNSVGDFLKGQKEFRIFPFVDNRTPWSCSP